VALVSEASAADPTTYAAIGDEEMLPLVTWVPLLLVQRKSADLVRILRRRALPGWSRGRTGVRGEQHGASREQQGRSAHRGDRPADSECHRESLSRRCEVQGTAIAADLVVDAGFMAAA
jgi:hypothetical protein